LLLNGPGICMRMPASPPSWWRAEKQAQLFFTLAAKDPEQHLQNIGDLSDLLMTEGLIDQLLAVNSVDDFKAIVDAGS
ncbi:PTS sugar transporter subunit IIA, partial [Lacticaseibacillus rhamnosus]|uniref:PTS sugar transporter subunit IIA n=1 Tax=Lacticaseibacillus rhamnosus TaxID=47715 RepID=UPI0034A2A5AD